MPKTFDIRLEIEEIALGAVLRKLNEMPGIVRLHLDLERGGEGAGRKQLEDAAKTMHSGRETLSVRLVQSLVDGPKNVQQLHEAIGGIRQSIYGALNYLRKQGLTEPGEGYGVHRLTQKAQAQMGLVKSLPSPADPAAAEIKPTPTGRNSRGSGNAILKEILSGGPKTRSDIRALANEKGFSERSIGGVLDRAKRDGLVKKLNGFNGGYELTAKGQKIEMMEVKHG